jgi:hypothetical protein
MTHPASKVVISARILKNSELLVKMSQEEIDLMKDRGEAILEMSRGFAHKGAKRSVF